MISVLDHIEHLAVEHDCVIVPGLGAFISQYSSSKNAEGVIVALKRSISFNMSIAHNDGLLVNSLMRRECIGFDAANDEIQNFVCSLRSQLRHEGEVPVGRIGFLKYNSEDSFEFIPFASLFANNEYFGLSSLTLRPLAELVAEEIAEQKPKQRIVPFARRFMRVAASIILLLTLTFVLSTPVIKENNQNYANLNAFAIQVPTIVEPQTEVQDSVESTPVVEECVAETESVITEMPKEEKMTKSMLSETSNYCLVVASLANQKQAEQFIRENNLTDCATFKSTTKVRVYIARGTYNEMINLKTSHYADSDAWVCRM